MTAITSLDQLDLTKLYTYADYLQWKFEERVELIRGAIVQMAAPRRLHQDIAGSFYHEFRFCLKNKNCKAYIAPFDVRLPVKIQKGEVVIGESVVQPDVCIICDSTKLDDLGCNGAPDLIVEVISPGSRKNDAEIKKKLYEEAGVKEYWLVIPNDKLVFKFALEGVSYSLIETYTDEDVVISTAVEGLSIPLNAIFPPEED